MIFLLLIELAAFKNKEILEILNDTKTKDLQKKLQEYINYQQKDNNTQNIIDIKEFINSKINLVETSANNLVTIGEEFSDLKKILDSTGDGFYTKYKTYKETHREKELFKNIFENDELKELEQKLDTNFDLKKKIKQFSQEKKEIAEYKEYLGKRNLVEETIEDNINKIDDLINEDINLLDDAIKNKIAVKNLEELNAELKYLKKTNGTQYDKKKSELTQIINSKVKDRFGAKSIHELNEELVKLRKVNVHDERLNSPINIGNTIQIEAIEKLIVKKKLNKIKIEKKYQGKKFEELNAELKNLKQDSLQYDKTKSELTQAINSKVKQEFGASSIKDLEDNLLNLKTTPQKHRGIYTDTTIQKKAIENLIKEKKYDKMDLNNLILRKELTNFKGKTIEEALQSNERFTKILKQENIDINIARNYKQKKEFNEVKKIKGNNISESKKLITKNISDSKEKISKLLKKQKKFEPSPEIEKLKIKNLKKELEKIRGKN